MPEKPILFSTPMVQAIFDGRKTQTRRVMKPQPEGWLEQTVGGNWGERKPYGLSIINQPYYPRDILWVRETFFCEPCLSDCTGREDENECPFNRVGEKCYGYKAQYTTGDGGLSLKWKPSIHMPREAARIFLRVTDVRAERLQDITPSEAKAEGIAWEPGIEWTCGNDSIRTNAYVSLFADLWDTLNAKRGHGWDANSWVWVYTFERTEATP